MKYTWDSGRDSPLMCYLIPALTYDLLIPRVIRSRMNSNVYNRGTTANTCRNDSDYQWASHLTMGSFSLTPSVRSTNTRKGFRLCEPEKGDEHAHPLPHVNGTYLGYQ